MQEADAAQAWVRTRAAAEAHLGSVCFKTGPPRLHGVELEWTVHHRDDRARPLHGERLAAALGCHAPPTVAPDSEHRPLPGGSRVTLEPGGQVELATPPSPSLATLWRTATADAGILAALLETAGFVLGRRGCDPHRSPRRVLEVPRYAAMHDAFDRIGPDGAQMMCCTAAVQLSLDAGEADQVPARWAAAHALGPVLIAMFANSPHRGGVRTGWASERMRAVLGMDPPRSRPERPSADPAAAWARRVVDTPVMCVRRAGGRWDAPVGMTFADWLAGALSDPPTVGDLEYHASTMFTPVRPQGYLEVRYLDAQPDGEWIVPVGTLAALMADPTTVDKALAVTEPAADRWMVAARQGLADPVLARVARDVADLASDLLGRTDLPSDLAARITETLQRVVD